MSQEPKVFVKLTRRKNNSGGVHLYIDDFTLNTALKEAGIPTDAKELYAKRFILAHTKGKAKILIEITTTKETPS